MTTDPKALAAEIGWLDAIVRDYLSAGRDRDAKDVADAVTNLLFDNLPTILAALRAASSAETMRGKPHPLPRLTDAMIRAACRGHYKTDNVDGLDMTVDGINYSFRQAFRRMWRSMRALSPEPGSAPVEGWRPIARPLDEWTEDMGDVLWWRFPIEEPPYLGSPLDCGQEVLITVSRYGHENGESRHMVGGWPGYHTHFTLPPPPPADPTRDAQEGERT